PDFMMYSVYKFLINAVLYDSFDRKGRKHALKIMHGELTRMKKLSRHCPDNYIFHYYAMQAELARIKNKPSGDVLELYDQAIEFAKKYKFLNFIAVYNERAAKYLLSLNKQAHASSYMREARYNYERWGATEKVKCLDEKYAGLLSAVTVGELSKQEIMLDYTTILKLTKYLFEETNTEKLIEKILKILAENIGSQYCVLMLKQKDSLLVEGVFDATENRLEVLSSRSITEDILPANLVNYVFRTGKDIVIDDITKHPEYSQFPYVKSHSAKSIICVPIISHKNLVGIFYGEHREITGAFTNERAELLRVLSGVIAISLENSRYVDHMVRIYKKTECFVPKAFLEILMKENVEEVALGDCVKKDITVLFNDIRSFTTLVEKRTPETAFAFVNRYWKFIAPIIRKHRGYIDQFQGDGLLAIFPEHPEDAVRASIDMMHALAEFNASQVELQDEPVRMGIGISTGSAMLGVIGEEDRHVAGLISDVANTSSRVEGLNKVYGSRILLSSPTVQALGGRQNFVLRKLDSVLLKGKTIPTEVYEVVEWEDKLKNMSLQDYLNLYASAFQAYFEGDFVAAKANFQRCLSYYSEDKAALILLERCSHFIENGAPKDWNGTFTMTSK
ncbi:MAG: GAF domain-containing protein, partial [Verrucomicrobia bacterium]|nr:GAF domain-containing protein [Verrucomicrobiota bacterium]